MFSKLQTISLGSQILCSLPPQENNSRDCTFKSLALEHCELSKCPAGQHCFVHSWTAHPVEPAVDSIKHIMCIKIYCVSSRTGVYGRAKDSARKVCLKFLYYHAHFGMTTPWFLGCAKKSGFRLSSTPPSTLLQKALNKLITEGSSFKINSLKINSHEINSCIHNS